MTVAVSRSSGSYSHRLFVCVQMITGLPPFYSRNRETMFEKIMKAELNFPQQISEVRGLCAVYLGPVFTARCNTWRLGTFLCRVGSSALLVT
jgi:hypothetical protein